MPVAALIAAAIKEDDNDGLEMTDSGRRGARGSKGSGVAKSRAKISFPRHLVSASLPNKPDEHDEDDQDDGDGKDNDDEASMVVRVALAWLL